MGAVAHLFKEDERESTKKQPARIKLTKKLVDVIEPPASGDCPRCGAGVRVDAIRLCPACEDLICPHCDTATCDECRSWQEHQRADR